MKNKTWFLNCLKCGEPICKGLDISYILRKAVREGAIIEKSFQTGFNLFCSEKCKNMYAVDMIIERSEENEEKILKLINPKPETY